MVWEGFMEKDRFTFRRKKGGKEIKGNSKLGQLAIILQHEKLEDLSEEQWVLLKQNIGNCK